MLLSKGISTVRTLQSLCRNPTQIKQIRNSSHHSWNYRKGPAPPSKRMMFAAEAVQGLAWWWVLWHLWTEPGHIFGEFEYPDASKWTNEELGIPAC